MFFLFLIFLIHFFFYFPILSIYLYISMSEKAEWLYCASSEWFFDCQSSNFPVYIFLYSKRCFDFQHTSDNFPIYIFPYSKRCFDSRRKSSKFTMYLFLYSKHCFYFQRTSNNFEVSFLKMSGVSILSVKKKFHFHGFFSFLTLSSFILTANIASLCHK